MENHFTIKRPFSQQMEDLVGGSYGAAKSFRSQMGISQLMEKIETFSQQMEDFTRGSYGAAKSFRSQMGISQPILMFGSHFVVILKLGDHFTVIWKFGNHLATKWEFRSPFFKLEAFS